MSGTSDKAAGIANASAGKVKQGVGSVVGSDKHKSENAAQSLFSTIIFCGVTIVDHRL